MSKEILLYSPIYSFTAANFINQMEENKDSDICVRGNCPGGDMFSTYGMIAKFKEHKKSKAIKVDGIAASAFAYMLCFADNVTCLDASTILFHRAVLGSEENERDMNENERKMLDSVNAQIRAAIESKVSSDSFKAITGYSFDDMFAMDKRIDVVLNATQAKQLGIVHDVIPLTASAKAEIMAMSASYGIAAFATDPKVTETTEIKNTIMTAAEFKAANPAAYAEIMAEGAAAEKTRVATWMVWNDVDPKAVAEGINSGKVLDPVASAEFGKKMFAKQGLKDIAADAPADVQTQVPDGAAKPEAAALAAFNSEVKANLSKIKIIQ